MNRLALVVGLVVILVITVRFDTNRSDSWRQLFKWQSIEWREVGRRYWFYWVLWSTASHLLGLLEGHFLIVSYATLVVPATVNEVFQRWSQQVRQAWTMMKSWPAKVKEELRFTGRGASTAEPSPEATANGPSDDSTRPNTGFEPNPGYSGG